MEKRDIAEKQLRAAAKYYKLSDYVCSITLSGAAEEITSKIAKKRRKFNQLELDVAYTRNFYDYVTGHSPTDKEIINEINKIKNALKHNDNGENEWVDDKYFEDEAASLFVKAVKNYYDAFGVFPKDRLITKLFDDLTL